jgi:hypothetical protein
MKKTFTKDFYLSHRGCYDFNKMFNLVDNNPHETIEDFLNWNISINDKFFFLFNYCNLTLRNKQDMALMCAKIVLPVYEKEFPNDSRVMECIHATELFLNGEITLEQLREKREAANANAYAYAYAAYAAYAAAYAAANAALAAANAANAYDTAALTAAANAAAYDTAALTAALSAAALTAAARTSNAAANAAAYDTAALTAAAYDTAALTAAARTANANANVANGLLNAVKEFCKKLPDE